MKVNSVLRVAIIAFALCDCAKTGKIPPTNANAFLNDYVLSKTGEDNSASISFWKKDVSWRTYNKMQLLPVMIKKNTAMGIQLTHAERTQLQESLEFHMREALRPFFSLAKSPGDGTLQMELMIIDTNVSEELAESFTTIHPSASALSALTSLLRTEAYTVRASVSAKITDSATGDLLMVSTDANDTLRVLGNSSTLWVDIQKFYSNWSTQLSYQLCLRQNRDFCEMPPKSS